MRRNPIILLLTTLLALPLYAQNEGQGNKVVVNGSIHSDILIPQEDEDIGVEKPDDWAQTNTYADVNLMSKYVDAGTRFEYLEHPLPGYEKDIEGWGLPYFYIKGKYKNAELTVGDFYEQFGSGFILRTYEERSLGIDNSLRGARLVLKPVNGLTFKALGGRQRRYWHHNHGFVSGADMEIEIDEWVKALQNHDTHLSLGGSYVNKYEKQEDIMVDPVHKLNLPEYVNSWDVRARLQKGGMSLLAEYAQKTQDPSFDNGYIYRKGYVAMLSASYSRRGLSALLQAKRSDNMAFRSRRSQNGTSSFINHLPAFTMEHTYTLAAKYPYATHPGGEWAYQAELSYNFKKNTALGGKYGTTVKLNFSHVHAIDMSAKGLDINQGTDATSSSYGIQGSDGYGSSFWKWGDRTYYQDLNIQIDKKLSKDFKLNLMYMNQFYNMTVIEGHGGMVHSDIFIAEGKYRFNNKYTLRGELQYLTTPDDTGDWMAGLLELSILPNWMVTVSDNYNVGETDKHYYFGSVTYTIGSHRLQVGYGRTDDGFNCSGGVCRYVPASKGLRITYNYNF